MSVLSNFVWGIADILRGPYKPNQYGHVILPFTILRRLECVMEPHREVMAGVIAEIPGDVARRSALRQRTATATAPGLTFWNSSAYTLERALEDPDNLAANLIDYVNGFSPDVDVFRNFGFEAQIKELDAHERLTLVTRAFTRVDLHPDVLDNAGMGDLFEELIYRFAEESNEHAGDFYTPRDAVRLLVDLVFAEDADALRERGVIRSVYDPTAGTGGLLSVAEEHLKAMNPNARLSLFAQEVNRHSYAICKSDLLIKGQDPTNVHRGDTLADDRFAGRHFDYILSNPPFGQDWKAAESEVRREHEFGEGGRFGPGLPPVGDGAMLFLLHVASKMRPVDKFGRGGRAGIVLNGSPLFTGAAGSGPSEIRGWLLQNDLVEAIVALPNDMFYNTGINTYLWILNNAKQSHRRGTVQLIDATEYATKLSRSLGNKRVEVSEPDRGKILQTYAAAVESDISKVLENVDFAYWSVIVERPLRLNFACTPDRVARALARLPKTEGLGTALESFGDAIYRDRRTFLRDIGQHLGVHHITLSAAQRKALWQTLGERDESAEACTDALGNPEPDVGLRETETIPYGWGGHRKEHAAARETIADYFKAEVLPHAPDAWIDHARTRTGWEIPFSYLFLSERQAYDLRAEEERFVLLEERARAHTEAVRSAIERFSRMARDEGWPTARLRRVARIFSGSTPTADEENWGGPLNWATPVDVNASNGQLYETARTISEEGRGSLTSLPPGSVLLTSRAPIGNVTVTRVETFFNQGCKGLVCGPHMTPECLAFQLMALKGVLESLGQGTTFMEINTDRVGDVSVVVPPLDWQQSQDFMECIQHFHDARRAFEELTDLARSRRRGVYRLMHLPIDRYGSWQSDAGV